MVACSKNVSLNFLSRSILGSILKLKLSDESLRGNACLVEDSHFALCDQLLTDIFEADLNSIVTILISCLDLRDYARASLKDCYRSEDAVLVEDLGHTDLLCKN